MKLANVIEAWDTIFFAPQSPLPISLFRILYGCVSTLTLVLLHPQWLAWYGPRSWITLSTMQQVEPGPRLNLFTLIPQDSSSVEIVFWVALLAAICLTIGLFTRVSAVAVFLCLTSVDQRNVFILHGGDTFLRVAGFFLMFAPAGAAFSIDRWLCVRKGKPDPELQPIRPWAQRMIQFELCILYFMSFWWKSLGEPWVDGTALSYVIQLDEMRRFPLPQWLLQPMVLKLGSWFTLALELALGTVIWIKEFRYPLLLLGIMFHLGIEYSLNVPLFQWDVLSAYVLFVDPTDILRVRDRVVNLFAARSRQIEPRLSGAKGED